MLCQHLCSVPSACWQIRTKRVGDIRSSERDVKARIYIHYEEYWSITDKQLSAERNRTFSLQTDLLLRPIRVRGEHTIWTCQLCPWSIPWSSPPSHLPSFTNQCPVYAWQTRMLKPACPHFSPPPASITAIAMYNRFTVRRSCATIFVNYCGRRGECVRAPSSLRPPLRHTAEKQRGILSHGQIKLFVAQERFCVVALYSQ